jgi:putative DNA primase/helicase
MPMELLAGNGKELRETLLYQGLIISTSLDARNHFNKYILSSCPKEQIICVNQVGWFNESYVLSGKVYGKQDGKLVALQSKSAQPEIKQNGSLSDWQENIGCHVHDSPILYLSVCVALAAPLLHLLGDENFLFHLSGSSSIGKTTALHVARSVSGSESHSWRTTDNAAESLARNANDGLLIFDEIGESDPKALSSLAYMLGNGSGKARANKNGDAKVITKFRCITLSTGEVGLESKLNEIEKTPRAGQSVRFIEIDADMDTGYGIYKKLGNFKNGEELSNHLNDACNTYYGTVIDEWLTLLVDCKEEIVGEIKTLREEWMHMFVPENANEQIKRCAKKFALLAAVGQVATNRSILPATDDQDSQTLDNSINELFKSWKKNRGKNSHELNELIKIIENFINVHGNARFEAPWGASNDISDQSTESASESKKSDDCTFCDQKTSNRAGFKRYINSKVHYYFFPQVFKKEILNGLNKEKYFKLLSDKGILKKDNDGKNTQSIRVPSNGQQRLLCITLDNININTDDDIS